MITYFIIYRSKIIAHFNTEVTTTTMQDLKRKVRAELRKCYVKKPGQGIFLEYDLNFSGEHITLYPKNLFTALLLSGYTVSYKMDYPFSNWKKFVVVYHPSCTGYFMV